MESPGESRMFILSSPSIFLNDSLDSGEGWRDFLLIENQWKVKVLTGNQTEMRRKLVLH